MQSTGSRDVATERRTRVPCPRCGQSIELSRLRAHLRDQHQTTSSELDSTFLAARRQARRASRFARR
jgi:adenine-specific DNA methylase